MARMPEAATPKGEVRNGLKPEAKEGDGQDQVMAHKMLNPECLSAALVCTFYGGALEMNAVLQELITQSGEVHRGDMKRPEAILVSQAHALNSLFVALACASHENMGGGHFDAADRYLRLALKAQSQCRATLETLAAIKNPPLVIAQQANVTTGPQQINNGQHPPSRTREIELEPNKLSGNCNELLPDTRASTAASRVDPQVAAVGERNRAEIRRG